MNNDKRKSTGGGSSSLSNRSLRSDESGLSNSLSSGLSSGFSSGTSSGTSRGSDSLSNRNLTIGESGHNSGGTAESKKSVFENCEIDVIDDEDLADVDDDISLGKSVESEEYIDNPIVEDVMRSADERLTEKTTFSIKKVAVYVVGVAIILSVIIGASLHAGKNYDENERIENIIEDRTSAFEFDDRDEYVGSIADKTADETADETAETEMTDAESSKNEKRLWDNEIPLENESLFPLPIKNYLVDPRFKTFDANNETPFFWQVPFVGGIFQSYMTACSKMVLASNHKVTDDDTMKIHMVKDHSYVNADLSTPEGIENAADQGLIEKDFADVIVSNHLHFTTNTLLDAKHKGRLFTALRHPVDRAITEYHYIVSTTNDAYVKNLSLKDFVSSKSMDKNWVTRFLVNKRQGPLIQEDLQLAKEILRRRCLVGLHEQIELSIIIFEQYFGWSAKELRISERFHDSCKREIMLLEESRARDVYAHVGDIDNAVYKKIVELNMFDMELYWYAYDLFEDQQLWFKSNAPGI